MDRPFSVAFDQLRGVERFLVFSSDPQMAAISSAGLDPSGSVVVAGLDANRSQFIMEVRAGREATVDVSRRVPR